jgi:protein TonB
MNTLLQRLDARLPFTKSERIIICIVLILHALPALEFIHLSSRPQKMDDERVMANLVSPEAAKTPEPSAAQPPKPKPEQKQKPVVEKSAEKPTPQPQQSSTPPKQQENKQESKSEAQAQSAAVAPSTSGGASGTPIQTDIGKLVVVYQPDADAYYPSFSKRSGEQGTAVVRLIIDETGSVEDVALLQSSSFPRLDRAASEIGRRYRFKPYLVNGSPQRISTNLLIKFNLK